MLTDDYPIDPYYEGRLAGFFEGRASRDAEIIRLNELLDYWFLRATNTPAQLREIEQRQLDQNFRAVDERFFGRAA